MVQDVQDVCRTCNKESLTWRTCVVNVQEKQIEEKFEKIYKEESETKSRRDRHNPQIWFYTWQTCVRSVFNVAGVYKTCVRRGTRCQGRATESNNSGKV